MPNELKPVLRCSITGTLYLVVPHGRGASPHAGRTIRMQFGENAHTVPLRVSSASWRVRLADRTLKAPVDATVHRMRQVLGEGEEEEVHGDLVPVDTILANCVNSAEALDAPFRAFLVERLPRRPGHCVALQATAGSGKTTLLLKVVAAHPDMRFLYICYNRSVCTEMQQRAAANGLTNVAVYTYDALALALTGGRVEDDAPGSSLEGVSTRGLAALCPQTMGWARRDRQAALDAFERFCRSPISSLDHWWETAQGEAMLPKRILLHGHAAAPTPADIRHVLDTLWRNGKPPHPTFATVKKLCYMEKALQRVATQYDMMLVDEAQDLNSIMVPSILEHLPHMPKVFVGDAMQSIYGFNGCVNAFRRLPPGATTHLHLYRTFRVGFPLTDYVNDKVPGVIMVPHAGATHSTHVHENKAPPLGVQYVYLVRTWKRLLQLAATTSGCWVPGLAAKAVEMRERLEDDGDALGLEELDDVLACVKAHAASDAASARVVFSTVHSFKGLEAKCVRLASDVRPNMKCLYYVALTRAMRDLYIDSDE